MKKRIYHIPIFVPHRGCPHDCIFCNQRHITGSSGDICADDAVKIIEQHLSTIGDFENSRIEIAFFGGSFTGIDFDRQTELLEAAYRYVEDGKVSSIRCSTRPDLIDDKILENLKRYAVGCVELGVQSTDADVLKKSRRGHSFEDVLNASRLIKQYEISLGLQMMIGLPGDSLEKTLKTAEDIIALKPECVRIYPTLVVADTALSVMYEGGKYTPLSLEEAVDRLSVIIPMFARAGTDIIRVGLQTTDEINAETVKGPYHPAIRELAQSRIMLRAVCNALGNSFEGGSVPIVCHPRALSALIGQHGCNREYLKKQLNAEMCITQDDKTGENSLKIFDKIVDIYASV